MRWHSCATSMAQLCQRAYIEVDYKARKPHLRVGGYNIQSKDIALKAS